MLSTIDNLKKLKSQNIFDILVIGGGINGSGIARDAAGRGLKTLLCEKKDWGAATSSASTKLIHGGLRYLESYEFSMVKSALNEREILYKSAPYMIFPLRFVLPHNKQQRPRWIIRAGLFLYDYLAGKNSSFQKSNYIKFNNDILTKEFKYGFVYTDCTVDDARLVLSNVADANSRGALTLSRTEIKSIEAVKEKNLWKVTISSKMPWQKRAKKHIVQTRLIVNAAGCHVNGLLQQFFSDFTPKYNMSLVKGSHIIVPKLYNAKHAYILQNDDGRIIFTIPYEDKYTLIGTTDILLKKLPPKIKISEEEKHYLCSAVNRYFNNKITKQDIIWDFSGVRPLIDDGSGKAQSVSRDYKLDISYINDRPILTVYGGKITGFRKLAENALDKILKDVFADQSKAAWTKNAKIWGGDLSGAANFEVFLNTLKREFFWLPEKLIKRYAKSYGSKVRILLKNCSNLEDMGKDLGNFIFEKEIEYLMQFEDAMALEDIIWRRSKFGLHISDKTKENIEKFIQQNRVKK